MAPYQGMGGFARSHTVRERALGPELIPFEVSVELLLANQCCRTLAQQRWVHYDLHILSAGSSPYLSVDMTAGVKGF